MKFNTSNIGNYGDQQLGMSFRTIQEETCICLTCNKCNWKKGFEKNIVAVHFFHYFSFSTILGKVISPFFMQIVELAHGEDCTCIIYRSTLNLA